MSGVLALAHLSPRPFSPRLLSDLAATMAFRGPAGTRCWHDQRAGLAFAAYPDTLPVDRIDSQPATVDGTSWIVADARLDERAALKSRLISLGETGAATAGDGLLLLHAFRAWGLDAFTHLTGDFACVIWLPREGRLVAARDPLGVRPLYHARFADGVAVSNTLSTLLALPGIDRRPDEDAVGDFLLFDTLRSPEATPFRAVRQVPPATVRAWTDRGSQSRCYWSFEDLEKRDAPADGAPADTWLAAFRHGFDRAVSDRLTTGRAAVLMSGGLDSTSIAVTAKHLLGSSVRLGLHTVAAAAPADDPEVAFARPIADALGQPHRVHALCGHRLLAGWEHLEPSPLLADRTLETATRAIDQALGADGPVVLTGHGGDALLAPDVAYFTRALRSFAWIRAWRYLSTAPRGAERRLPPLGLRSAWLLRRHRKSWQETHPSWIEPAWAKERDLASRWREVGEGRLHPPRDRRAAYAAGFRGWTTLFEQIDAGIRGLPHEYRHPFFDLRLLAVAARMPAVPWRVEKHVLREAMKDRMPESVRVRPKKGLPGVPAQPLGRLASDLWRQWTVELPEIGRFVDSVGVLEALRTDEATAPDGQTVVYRWENRRPLNLGLWIRGWMRAGVRHAPETHAECGGRSNDSEHDVEAALSAPTVGDLR